MIIAVSSEAIPNINQLTELEKENLGIEDEIEDSKFMVNRVVMEDEVKVLTLQDITDATNKIILFVR